MEQASEYVFGNNNSGDVQKRPSLFVVKVTDKYERVGSTKDMTIYFFLSVHRNSYGETQEEKEVKRSMEDFKALDRRIRADVTDNQPGVIPPRLSNKETSLVDSSPDSGTRFMGHYASERVMLQRYLDALLAHPITATMKLVEDFLQVNDFSPHQHFRASLAKRLTGAVEELWTSNYVDPDALFQQEKTNLNKYSGAVADLHNTFALQNMCKKTLSTGTSQVAASMSANGQSKDEVSKLLVLVAQVLTQEEHGWHLAYWTGELTLGTFLKHHIAQLDSFKDMFQRRTVILQELDTAKRVVTKASPQKKEAAATALNEQIQLVDRCTQMGKIEMERLKESEARAFRQALIDYAESQMKAARESYEILNDHLEKVRNWQP